MNREIKFRAWDKKHKKMIDWNELKTKYNLRLFECDWLELMQFTSLHDKNGKEIYEGDIIGTNERYQILPKYRAEWNEKHCCFTCIDGGTFNYIGDIDESIQYHLLSNMRLDVCEIIGNIYEN
jgi:uncharacterized phage protein (TIGR01671 family)